MALTAWDRARIVLAVSNSERTVARPVNRWDRRAARWRKRIETRRWFATFQWTQDWNSFSPHHRVVAFGVMRFVRTPDEATVPQRGKDYRGFRLQATVILPIAIRQWR